MCLIQSTKRARGWAKNISKTRNRIFIFNSSLFNILSITLKFIIPTTRIHSGKGRRVSFFPIRLFLSSFNSIRGLELELELSCSSLARPLSSLQRLLFYFAGNMKVPLATRTTKPTQPETQKRIKS